MANNNTTPAPNIIELEVSPGQAVGPFQLGTSLNQLISFIEAQVQLLPRVDFKYSAESPLEVDYVLHLPENGITLRVEPNSQRLRVIDIWDFSRLHLTYSGADLSHHSGKVVPTFVLVYKLFGPTFPGDLDAQDSTYALHYPGITFIFPIPKEHFPLYANSAKSDIPMEFPDGTTPLCSRIYVFAPNSKQSDIVQYNGQVEYGWRNSIAPRIPRDLTSLLEHHNGQEANEYLLERVTVVLDLLKTIVEFTNGTVLTIQLNETKVQDALTVLGPPEHRYRKREDKLKIHAMEGLETASTYKTSGTGGESDGYDDYFFNWYSLGLDVLWDGCKHVAKKVILHSNFPGHYDFDRYCKCPYRILPTEKLEEIDIVTVNSKWDDVERILGSCIGRDIILNRGATVRDPFGPSVLRGYSRIIFEVLKNRHLVTVTLF